MNSTIALRRSPMLAVMARSRPHFRMVSSIAPMNKMEEEKKDDRRTFHSTRMQKADATAAIATWATATSATAEPAAVKTFSVVDRFTYTAEVTISKIFPAGFGWQTASVVADGWGYAGDSFNFAVTTGLGDALGVLAGHVAYCGIKKSVYDSRVNMSQELQNGILLGTAAFCSGTAWQPIVNVLQGANLPFNSVFFGTWAGCGVAFYLGLRVGRSVLSGPLTYIEEPTYENQKNDASLSMAIGGATAFFVGTDAAYLPTQNWLIDAVGIKDGTPDMIGSCIAGSSTAMGFVVAQSTLNTIYPTGKLWTD